MYFWEAKGDMEVYEGRISHCHKECEIYYMIDGEAEFQIEGQVFHLVSDSFLLIPSNYFHGWKYSAGKIHHRINIHFLPELLNKDEQEFFLSLFSEPLHFLGGSRFSLDFFVKAIIECDSMEVPLQKIASKGRMVGLLSQIYHLRSSNAVKPVILDERIRRIIAYLEDHLREDISRDDISKRFAITKNHLNFIFHNTIGTPVMKYITIKRLGLARQEILNGVQIGEAAYRAGFNDYTTFFRSYKSFYGSAPSKLLVNSLSPSLFQA
jgi:AraC-like DNA-binding protein